MTPKIPNTEKILLVLKEINCNITSKDLAEYTNINHKNIGRYLTQLQTKKYISRKVKQVGQKRYNISKILAKGKNYKFTSTYQDLLTEIYESKLTNTEKKVLGNGITLNKENFDNAVKELEVIQTTEMINPNKMDVKAEILGMIKVIAIRNVDAKNLGFKGKQELTERMISLILSL